MLISQNVVRFHGGAVLPRAAAAADVPIALHLDYVTDIELLHLAVGAGFSSQCLTRARLTWM
ncbi:hypothetical protein [Glaciihabitans sp. UYNi722]|uniref:hypothetical protein n=1 Tax=Glaciihabitans sp. UYNi722 TaxID=3156344 RepID=UPI003396686E